MVHQQGDQRAEQQAEGGGRKGAERKALEHFVHGDEQSAEAETDEHAQNAVVRLADEGRRLADGITGQDAKAEE